MPRKEFCLLRIDQCSHGEFLATPSRGALRTEPVLPLAVHFCDDCLIVSPEKVGSADVGSFENPFESLVLELSDLGEDFDDSVKIELSSSPICLDEVGEYIIYAPLGHV